MTRSSLAGILPEVEPAFVPRQILGGSMRGDETILLVADDSVSRQVLSGALECMGYDVIPAASPGEAQVQTRAHVDVLVVDFHPGEGDALELARAFRQQQPHVKVLVMTSYLCEFARQVSDGENFAVLAKPFELGQFLSMIRLLCENRPVPSWFAEPPPVTVREELAAWA